VNSQAEKDRTYVGVARPLHGFVANKSTADALSKFSQALPSWSGPVCNALAVRRVQVSPFRLDDGVTWLFSEAVESEVSRDLSRAGQSEPNRSSKQVASECMVPLSNRVEAL
jgi:hypothetical protein